MNVYNCVVVGAGPAGLAYASTMQDEKLLVLDMGKPVEERGRDDPEECIQGAGGAGLFSDGKFSFYPAGTKIWEQKTKVLKIAYEALKKGLGNFKEIPPFPDVDPSDKRQEANLGWHLKPYPSLYIGLNDRIELIKQLVKGLNIQYQTEFLNYEKVPEGYKVTILKNGATETLLTKKIVLAGGRFMPLFLQEMPKMFHRYEFGFRLEGSAEKFEKEVNLIDPKYTKELAVAECRTFCWCSQGEVVPTRFKEIQTFSGRADCPPTGLSNFGFNYRVRNTAIVTDAVFKEIMGMKPFHGKLENVSKVIDLFPEAVRPILAAGLEELKKKFPKLNRDISIKGPTIEGVGEYPITNEEFQLANDPNVCVIGDASGIYRGIVASMLSGYSLAVLDNQKGVNDVCCK